MNIYIMGDSVGDIASQERCLMLCSSRDAIPKHRPLVPCTAFAGFLDECKENWRLKRAYLCLSRRMISFQHNDQSAISGLQPDVMSGARRVVGNRALSVALQFHDALRNY